jgi:hypothetical protein
MEFVALHESVHGTQEPSSSAVRWSAYWGAADIAQASEGGH